MPIPRQYDDLKPYLKPGRVLIIYGPRRTGKTTLLKNFLKQTTLKYKLESGENIRMQQILSSQDFDQILDYASGYDLIAIDEAQRVPNVGQGLKIMVDQLPRLKIIVTGSSSFELAGQVGEPLTDRKTTLTLFPASQKELLSIFNKYELKTKLPEQLIFGSYPKIIKAKKPAKIAFLNELVESYLLKDILELEKVRAAKLLLDLLRLVAFQVGSLVSLTELAGQLKIDYKTVARYLDLFEKSFILYNLRGYSGNLRKEVTKTSKYYFYDNGVRNAVISNFNPLNLRDDVGRLWENFLAIERLKLQKSRPLYANNYFWRTWDKREIDWVEERGGKIHGFEFKWSAKKKVKIPKDWANYKNSEFKVITPDNYLDFIT